MRIDCVPSVISTVAESIRSLYGEIMVAQKQSSKETRIEHQLVFPRSKIKTNTDIFTFFWSSWRARERAKDHLTQHSNLVVSSKDLVT